MSASGCRSPRWPWVRRRCRCTATISAGGKNSDIALQNIVIDRHLAIPGIARQIIPVVQSVRHGVVKLAVRQDLRGVFVEPCLESGQDGRAVLLSAASRRPSAFCPAPVFQPDRAVRRTGEPAPAADRVCFSSCESKPILASIAVWMAAITSLASEPIMLKPKILVISSAASLRNTVDIGNIAIDYRSIHIAMPMPPPMHSVARPLWASLRCIS